MVAISWFLAVGMICYLGSMLYTLVVATMVDDVDAESPSVLPSRIDHSNDETIVNYSGRTSNVGVWV